MDKLFFDRLFQKVEYCGHIGKFSDYVGLSLLYAVLYKRSGNEYYNKRFQRYISELWEMLQSKEINRTIDNGLSSVLWLLRYLNSQELLEVSQHQLGLMAQQINNEYIVCMKHNNWVYTKGGLGCLNAVESLENYNLLLDYIEDKLKKEDNTVISSVWYNERTNLGLIYGILGILHFLNRTIAYKIQPERAIFLRNKILDTVLRNYIEELQCYPSQQGIGSCRLCLAYGELTMAYQVYLTALLNHDPELKARAVNYALASTERNTLHKAFIVDSCLQHGAAGNYVLYRLFYEKTGLWEFRTASKLWCGYIEEILLATDFKLINRHTNELEEDYSLLTGLSGVYLALSGDESWLSYLLLNDVSQNVILKI